MYGSEERKRERKDTTLPATYPPCDIGKRLHGLDKLQT